MNNVRAITVVVQLMFVCAPLISQAAALDCDLDSGQLRDLNRKLFQDSLNQHEKVRVKDTRHVLSRERGRMFAMLQQSDLLQEFLPSGVSCIGSGTMAVVERKSHKLSVENSSETGLLEELLVAPPMP